MISQRAEGSMRDAQSMLEQVLAFSGGTATEVDIRPIMGLRGSETVSAIAKAIMSGDEAGVLTLTGDAFDGGVDPLDLVVSLTEWIRYLLIASIDQGSRELQSLTDETRRELVGETEGVTTEHLLSLLTMVADAEDSVKRAGHQRYLLEAILLRMTHVRSIAKISTLIDMLKKTESGGAPGAEGAKGANKEPRKAASPKPAQKKKKTAEPGQTGSGQAQPATAGMVSGWQDIVEGLRETKTALASVLDLCEPPKLSEGVYWLQVPTSFHESQVLKGQNLRILTQEFQKLTNTSAVIRTRVTESAREQARDAAEAPVSPPEEPSMEELAALVNKDPIVKSLIENLGGKVVEIRQQKKNSSQEEPAS
jgi:DNA polymerase-3 subunit gamma/tau